MGEQLVMASTALAVTLNAAAWFLAHALAPQQAPTTAQAPAPANSAQSTDKPADKPADKSADKVADKPEFKQEELDQMLAPIALYPDALLSQVLMASTYPLEVVEADRWAKANKTLKGDPAAKALEKEKWDASVKSLIDFASIL